MRHPRIERLMPGVISKSGEHSKHFGRLRLTPGESAPQVRYDSLGGVAIA